MNIYPVIIATLCRYEHFKRCVESLAACSLADRTELVIGLDYPLLEEHKNGYKQITSYLNQITGFKKVTILNTTHNLGPSKNYQRLYEYAYSKYEAVIFTEDDNEFSPCFLEFMNKALNKFKDTKNVLSISGYTAIDYYNITTKQAILTHDVSAWGTGYWKYKSCVYFNQEISYYQQNMISIKNAFKVYKVYPRLLSMLLYMINNNLRWGDTEKATYNIINNVFQLRPSISMVRNLGQDGTGLHCGINEKITHQKILNDNHFDFKPEESLKDYLLESSNIQKYSFYLGMSKARLHRFCSLIKIAIYWIIYFMKNKLRFI